MGSVPSRETHRRGIFSVQQQFPSANDKNASGSASAAAAAMARKQEIVLIPLTKEFFPSPDCPLFVQFHKARCDAAVNYYFRRPGNPGDLSGIPSYASSYRLPGEEEALQQRRRERADRKQQRAAAREAAAAASPLAGGAHRGDNLFDLRDVADDLAQLDHSGGEDDDDDDDEEEAEEDESYPSREALYRGVVERVEDALFDTDAEMCEAFQWARAHPHTTMGPNGRKQRKVLPVLCAVAFRYDPNKVAAAAAMAAGLGSPTASSSTTPSAGGGGGGGSATPAVSAQHQAAVENGVYMFGSIINIVGCFGFVSMEEEVAALKRELELRNHAEAGPAETMAPTTSSMGDGGGTEVMHLSSPQSPTTGRRYKHDPYSFTSSQDSSVSNSLVDGTRSGSLLVSRASVSSGGGGFRQRATTAISSLHAMMGTGVAIADPNSPPPVAAPLAAMVFLTKSAGEQNLGRVTHIAATTYYFQLIQAGVIPRQAVHVPAGATALPPPPYYGPTGSSTLPPGTSPTSPQPPVFGVGSGGGSGGSGGVSQGHAAGAASTHHPQAHLPLPPMETFSFSSLLTNIPILSFVYEMKCRWGYLGVFRGTPTSTNGSFTEPSPASAAASGGAGLGGETEASTDGATAMTGAHASAHHRALLMGTHSFGGLSGVDRTVGQNLTDEIEMWVTMDQMLHGRISKDLAERLCWALAEHPEVMHERVLQLPSEESGYWRYGGLVDSAHPPPLPQPNVESAPIHPRDVYVMGSDVLPGFNEGDILRFDPERVVWFSDPSIPLEGVVLAAMRPYCKQAREAPPNDPGWVTRIESAEKLAYDQAREARENPALFQFIEGEAFPLPAPTPDQAATLRIDSRLTRVHEHVGNFFVYKFERDGTPYYHGTVPNFANPNKKRAASVAVPPPSSTATSAAGGPPPPSLSALTASPALSTGSGKPSHTGTAHAANTATPAPTTSGNANNNNNTNSSNSNSTSATGSTGVEVPKSIASALFSLAQAGTATVQDKKAPTSSAATGTAADPATAIKSPGSSRVDLSVVGCPDGAPTSPSATGATSATHTNANPSPSNSNNNNNTALKPAPAYLTGRVTSATVMRTARRWMENLYSYAYGAPKANPDGAMPSSERSGGSRGPTPSSHVLGMSPVPPPRSPMTPMARTTSPGASWSSYPGKGSSGGGGGGPKLGSPVSTGLSMSGGGRGSEDAAAVWPKYNYGKNGAGLGTFVGMMPGSPAPSPSQPQLSQPQAHTSGYARGSPAGTYMNYSNSNSYQQHQQQQQQQQHIANAVAFADSYAAPSRGPQSTSYPQPGPNYGAPFAQSATSLTPPMLLTPQGNPAGPAPTNAYGTAPPTSPQVQRSGTVLPATRRYTIGENGCYVWTWS